MLGFVLRLSIIVIAFTSPALAAPEDEALQAFNSLYGEEVKRVLATPDTADDVALAGKLFEAAKTVTSQPALLAVLCEKAADLGKPTADGRATAVQAMELVIGKVPERKAACLGRITALRQIDYDTSRPEGKAQAGEALIASLLALTDAKAEADDSAAASDACRKALAIATALKLESRATIQAHADSLAAHQKAEQKIAALKARLESAPTNAAARAELVTALVVEFDDPAAAAKFVDTSLDATLQKFVPAAAKGLDQTPELACLQLGDWYRSLAEQAVGAAKPPMATRARAYYKRFLDLHTTEDVERAQVTLATKKLDDITAAAVVAKADTSAKPPAKAAAATKAAATTKAAAAGAAAADTLAANQWHDVLRYVDTAKDPVTGAMPIGWRRDKAAIVCLNRASSESKITVPVMPQGSYDLQTVLTINEYGSGGVYLPAGTGSVMLHIYTSGTSGLAYVNGRSAYNNGTGLPTTIGIGIPHRVDVRVILTDDQASITATLDDKPLVQWSGPQSALSPYNSGNSGVDRRCLGLHGYYSTVTFGAMRMRPAQEARLYKSDGKGPQPARSK